MHFSLKDLKIQPGSRSGDAASAAVAGLPGSHQNGQPGSLLGLALNAGACSVKFSRIGGGSSGDSATPSIDIVQLGVKAAALGLELRQERGGLRGAEGHDGRLDVLECRLELTVTSPQVGFMCEVMREVMCEVLLHGCYTSEPFVPSAIFCNTPPLIRRLWIKTELSTWWELPPLLSPH